MLSVGLTRGWKWNGVLKNAWVFCFSFNVSLRIFLPGKLTWNHIAFWKGKFQVIQFVTLEHPLVGCHQQPLSSGHVNSPSQKGHDRRIVSFGGSRWVFGGVFQSFPEFWISVEATLLDFFILVPVLCLCERWALPTEICRGTFKKGCCNHLSDGKKGPVWLFTGICRGWNPTQLCDRDYYKPW